MNTTLQIFDVFAIFQDELEAGGKGWREVSPR